MASTASRRNLGRISEIAQVAVRHGFGYFFETHRLTDLLPGRPKLGADAASPSERGRHLREMLDELGPTFVKFGQLLSTRPDVVPPDIVVELQKLQDDVRPVPYEDVERVIREDLELSVEQLFTDFDPTPIAAASIGQVHRATLPTGRRVAVKVQRPNAPRQIEADLALLYQAARLIRERVRALEFIDPRQLVDEFARSIRQELDYRLEARNAEAFHHRFAGHPHVHIPRVYWSYTRTRVLTLELIEGIQLADLPLDAWEMEERRRLAYLMAETWMTMIFRHGFFHGDPHPANIFVVGDAEHIGIVDFGQVGKLTDEDMSKLTRLFIDAASERIDALPRRLAELGVRYPKEREDEFVAELREMYARYYGASLAEIDPLQVIREAFQLIYRLNLRLPTRFVMLDKAIATLGVGRRRPLPGLQRLRGGEAIRARADAGALHAAAGAEAGALGGDRAGADRAGSALPGARRAGGVPRRPDRGRLRAQGARRVHAQARRRLQPARDRAGHGRRPDRLEPDRDLLDKGPADRRRELLLFRRLRALRDPRAVAALGRAPLRTVVESSSHFRAKGHLARAWSRG